MIVGFAQLEGFTLAIPDNPGPLLVTARRVASSNAAREDPSA